MFYYCKLRLKYIVTYKLYFMLNLIYKRIVCTVATELHKSLTSPSNIHSRAQCIIIEYIMCCIC